MATKHTQTKSTPTQAVSRRFFHPHSRREETELLLIFLICFLIAFCLGFFSLTGTLSPGLVGEGLSRLPLSILPGHVGNGSEETPVYDPYLLYQDMVQNLKTYLVIDVRSKKEYAGGHLQGALSYPLYASLARPDDSKANASDFAAFVNRNLKPKQTVVVYSYSQYAQSGKDGVVLLRERGIQALLLGVGWNEWDHFKTLWVPEGAWDTVDISRTVSLPD